MSYTFSMTEDALAAGIKKIPDSKRAFVQEVQNLLKAGVEYAVLKQNGTYLNNILEALDGTMADVAGRYMSREGMPFEYKDGKLAFKQARALAVLKNLGKPTDKPKNGEQLPEEALEFLLMGVLGTMSGAMWDTEAVKAAKAAKNNKNADKTPAQIAEALKKRIEKAMKEAQDEGIDLSEVAPEGFVKVIPSAAPAPEQEQHHLSEKMQQIVTMLEPHEGTDVLDKILMAVSTVLVEATTKKAA